MTKSSIFTKFGILALLSFSSIAPSHALTQGTDYTILNTAPSSSKEIREFISFYCSHCYEFDMLHNSTKVIKEKLKEAGLTDKVKFAIQSIELFYDDEVYLTQGLLVAQQLGIEEKTKELLFNSTIKERVRFKTDKQVKEILIKAGGDPKLVESQWNALSTKLELAAAKKLVQNSKINGTPTFIVNGRYQLDLSAIKANSWEGFVNELAKRLIELSQLP